MGNAITARLGLDAAGFRKGLDEASAASSRAGDKFAQDSKRSLKEAAAGQRKILNEHKAAIHQAAGEFAGALGLTLSVGAAVGAGNAVVAFASKLGDTSAAIGINVEKLQELQGAFGQSGASAEVVEKSLVKLSESLSGARAGDEKLIRSFEGLGVTWEDINKLAPDEIIDKIAASAGDARDPAERLSFIMDVMGKSGTKMAAGLNGGAEGLKKLRAEVKKLSSEDIGVLKDAEDVLTRFGTALLVLGAQGITQVIKPKSFAERNRQSARLAAGLPAEDPFLANVAASQAAKQAGVPMSPDEVRGKADLEKSEYDEFKAAQDLARMKLKTVSEIADEQATNAMKAFFGDMANANKVADAQDDRAEKQRDDDQKAADDLLEKQKKNDKERADDAATANKANAAALSAQQAQSKEQFVAGKNDPNAARNAKRQSLRDRHLGERYDREQALKERGGKSEADVAAENRPSLSDRTKAREEFGPQEGVVERSLRGFDDRKNIRGGLANGRKADAASDNLKSALDSSKVLGEIKANTDKLGVNL